MISHTPACIESDAAPLMRAEDVGALGLRLEHPSSSKAGGRPGSRGSRIGSTRAKQIRNATRLFKIDYRVMYLTPETELCSCWLITPQQEVCAMPEWLWQGLVLIAVGIVISKIMERLGNKCPDRKPHLFTKWYPGSSLLILGLRRPAFEKECHLYHDFNPPDNTVHPARPAGTQYLCPRCGDY